MASSILDKSQTEESQTEAEPGFSSSTQSSGALRLMWTSSRNALILE